MECDEWRTPPGVSQSEFAHLHSMENLAQRGNENWEHMQVVTHRGFYSPGIGLPENGLSSLRASVGRGHRNHEYDIVQTKNGYVVDHDFSPLRTTGTKGLYVNLETKEIEGKSIAIRQFLRENFAPDITLSNDKVMEAGRMLREAMQVVPTGSFFADCRNGDILGYSAWLSWHLEYSKCQLVMFYTFTLTSGKEIVRGIERYDPHPEWRKRLKYVLNLYPSELVTLATRYGMPANNVGDLTEVGKKLLGSLKEAGIPLFSLLTMCSGIDRTEVTDLDDLEVRQAVDAEDAIIEVVKWARECLGIEHLKIGSGTRAYDVSIPQADGTRTFFTYDLYTGALTPWPTKPGLRRIRELYSTPGQAERALRPDFMCTDEPESAAFWCCDMSANTSRGFRHPRFDTVVKKEVTLPTAGFATLYYVMFCAFAFYIYERY